MDALPELSDLERDVMLLVWANSPVTAESIRKKLDRKLSDSTVRTILRRLESKGYVTHILEGRTYSYKAANAQRKVAAKAVERIIDWFCNGSVEEMLVGMVHSNMLNPKQMQALAAKIIDAKGKKGAK